ncbi:hypothetical protein EOM57_03460 [Candidatus Saccharibacteria bacterium]|nr:hypothetical protein [Candidatus Saccharibacteria bacterium]
MSANATTSINNWNFDDKHVQENLTGGDFIGSHSVVICATAPRLSEIGSSGIVDASSSFADDDTNESMGTGFAIPIGVMDSSAIQQDRQLQQIFEIGSTRSYLMSARTLTSMQLNRVMYKGANLLRMLYAYYPALGSNGVDQSNRLDGIEEIDSTTICPEIKNGPGYHNFWMNLSSDIFSQPMGLVLFMKNNHKQDVGAVFLEECYVQNHSLQVSANSIVMAESSVVRCERIVPIKVRVG